ncbi:DUF1961 family protein [Actinobacteria bacterium YIM 96077]|uniref:DUF1961 domain-containing protein n=1 Tax=Phytoactinopolyspora halophila TaxID=1981511 RepID=A0A329QXH6_9ACTN|nr:DUF1961 family protein [Phytoactinopolyspora halophila]AYY14890.1 DUF1961 family protein [Actinobacteria bacterium YIM 96077]RAW15348.1 DUF1961 domain-containing protein [Phytoactinopolyspora halophila]
MDPEERPYRIGRQIYANPLSSEADVADFRLEGSAHVTFPHGRMRLANVLDPAEGQRANFVLWCPHDLPPDIAISWTVLPVHEPGLCMLFFAAAGRNGEDIFDSTLNARDGEYDHYRYGDINALHVSYFRRTTAEARAFRTCNLRKSHGFHLVAQGGDPLPDVDEMLEPYRATVLTCGPDVELWINDLQIFTWHDDGHSYGPPLGGGKIGFRQMAPLVAEYEDLQVHSVERLAGQSL